MRAPTAACGRVVTTLAVFLWYAALLAAAEPAPLRIVATLFPQYDFARQIAGDRAEVRLLLPPGAESHSYEPTPADMKAIADADLFVYTGEHMEPWAKRLVDAAPGANGPVVVDASAGIALHRDGDAHAPDPTPDHDHDHEHCDHEHHEHHEHQHAHGGHYHEFDPHIWLNPLHAAAMADTIAAALADRDPDHADDYRANARRLRAELEELDRAFAAEVDAAPRRTLVFGERFAFAYFFDRYGLEKVGAYTSCAPGAEPGLRAVTRVIDYVRRHDVRYIYCEAMSTPRISTVIREETGAAILEVDSMHTLPADRLAAGDSYQTVMRATMAAFAKGLQ